MSAAWRVLRLEKCPQGADLAAWQEDALRRARAAALPAGCLHFAHSQPIARAYRQDEPAFDALEEHAFADLAAARAFRAQAADAGGQALLTRVVTVVPGGAGADAPKHVELLKRRPGTERSTFASYWRDVHGPLAAAIPALLRYEQCPAEDGEYAAAEPAFDGVALLRFVSIDAMREGARSPMFAAAREDMPRFMDAAASRSVLTQERWALTR